MSDTSLTDSLLNDEGLNEREVAFLDQLFDIHKGDIRSSMSAVGYPSSTPTSSVTKKLSAHIKNRAKDYLTGSSALASISLVSVLSDPSAVGNKNTIAASKDILDRAGIFKEEQPQITEVRNMFILPPKDLTEEDS